MAAVEQRIKTTGENSYQDSLLPMVLPMTNTEQQQDRIFGEANLYTYHKNLQIRNLLNLL